MHLSPPNHILVILREEPPPWQEGISGDSLPRPSSDVIVPKRKHECNPFSEETLSSAGMTITVRWPDRFASGRGFGLDPIVRRRSHRGCSTDRADRVIELFRRHPDPPPGTRHPADRLLHQRATEVVRPGPEDLRRHL